MMCDMCVPMKCGWFIRVPRKWKYVKAASTTTPTPKYTHVRGGTGNEPKRRHECVY